MGGGGRVGKGGKIGVAPGGEPGACLYCCGSFEKGVKREMTGGLIVRLPLTTVE